MDSISQHSLAKKLPRYTHALARLTRALCVRHTSHPGLARGLTVGGLATPAFARPLRLDLDSAHGPASVLVDGTQHSALHTICDALDPDRTSALANFWLADFLAELDVEGARPTVRSLSCEAPDRSMAGLHLTLAANDTRVGVIVTDVPHRLAQVYEQTWAPTPGRADLDRVGDLTAPTTLRLRSRLCSPTVLASLRRHDVLVGWQPALRYAEGAPLGAASLRIGAPRGRQLHASVRLDTHTITLESAMSPASAGQQNDFDPLAGERSDSTTDPLVSVGAMELPVHVELVSVNLSVAQLSSLQPGYVLDVPLPIADAAVRLVSYGQTLAFGKLVAVGEHLGVQIERMAGSDERQS